MGIMGMMFSITSTVIVFGFVLIVRYLQYRETLELADRGLIAPSTAGTNGNGRGILRWGIVFTFVGIAATCGLYPLGWWFDNGGDFPARFGPWMLLGLLPMACGLALLTIAALTKNGRPSGDDRAAVED